MNLAKKMLGTSLSKNMIMSVISRIVTLITGLIIQKEILLAFGSVINGLTSSISQVMSYLILLEAGLGTASIQALYSPLADDDWGKVSGILSATKVQYKKIAGVFLLLLLGASAILPFSVGGEVEYGVAAILTLVTGGSYVLSYIVGGKYKAILNSDRKLYVLYALEIASVLASCVFRVIALQFGAGIVIVQLINLAAIAIKNIGYVLYVKRKYPKIDHAAEPDIQSTSKRKSVFVHNIAGVVVNHTDIMILTIFASMSTVSVYSVYNLVYSQFITLFQTAFGNALQGSLGRIYNKDRQSFERYFSLYETLFTILLFIICTITIIMILPFIRIYTSGVTDANYIDFWLPVLFTIILLMNLVRTPTGTVIIVAGAFKETQRDAIIEAVINLVASLALFFFTDLGMHGLLIGTIISYMYRSVTSIVYSYRHLIKSGVGKLLRTLTVNFAVSFILYYILAVLVPINATSWGGWILSACAVSLISLVAFGVANIVFNFPATKELFNFCKSILVKTRRNNADTANGG